MALGHTLTNGPHQLCHSGFRGHIPTLNDAQLQKLVANLIHIQVRAVVQALGGYHHANAVLNGSLDAAQALLQHIDTAQAEGFHHDALVAHGGKHIKDLGI